MKMLGQGFTVISLFVMMFGGKIFIILNYIKNIINAYDECIMIFVSTLKGFVEWKMEILFKMGMS